MKKILSSTILAIALSAGAARGESEDREYLIESSSVDNGTSALALRSGSVLGQSTTMIGGNTLWGLGRYLSAGIGFYTLASEVRPEVSHAGNVNFYYGGLELEAPLFSYRYASLALSAHAGFGQVSYRGKDLVTTARLLTSANVRVLEPSLEAFAHVSRRTDLGFSFGMRRVSEPAIAGFGTDDLDSRVLSILLRGHF